MGMGLTGRFRDLSIETKMLAIILPLVAIPMIALGTVGYLASAREATASGARYLKERLSDAHTIAENPAIHDYFDNRYYGLIEEAEVYRRDLERSLLQFVERMNGSETIYRQLRYADDTGDVIAKIADGAVDLNRASVSGTAMFAEISRLRPGEIYASLPGPEMTYAMPIHESSGSNEAPTFQGAVILDFNYPIEEFRRSSRLIGTSFVVLTLVSLGGAMLLTVNRVRHVTRPIRRLAVAANQIAAGKREIAIDVESRDEVGRLAQSFRRMTTALQRNEAALQRKVVETTTLYEIGREISAQVALEPTLELIVTRACALLKSDAGWLALREEGGDDFSIRARTGVGGAAIAGVRFRPGEGLGGRVVASGAPMRVGDYLGEFPDSPFLSIIKDASLRSFIAAPLKSEDGVNGVLYVLSTEANQFDDEDLQLLSALATQATISINNAKLYQQVRQHAQQLEARIAERTRELRELNRRLEEASRHKSEFLANMSHELRTPMNAIIGFTRIVMRRSKEQLPPRQYENLQKVLGSADHLLTLINQILDLSKIEAGRLDLYPSHFGLESLIGECLRTIEPLTRPDKVVLSATADPGLPELVTDRDKLKQILLDLLSNAAKFTEAGTIDLHAWLGAGAVQISVADTGRGIPADKLNLIFEEFRQVDSGSTRQHGGTGLGLSISRHLARLMGGDVSVQSIEGQGSTFTLTISARLADAASANGCDAAAAPKSEVA